MHLERMHVAFATITSSCLQEFSHCCWTAHTGTLDSTLAALARLRDIDDLLSQPHFSNLCRIQLDYHPRIYMEDIPRPSDGSIVQSADGSALHPGPSSQIERDGRRLNEAEAAFALYAERLLQDRFLEELKEFSGRGKLEIKLEVDPKQFKEKEKDSKGKEKERQRE